MNSDLCSLHAAWVFCCSHWELLSQYLLCSSFQNKSLVLLVETRPLVCLAAGRFCWMFQFKSGFPFHWLLKTRQEEGNQTAEQTSFTSKNLCERSHPGQTLRKSLLTVLKFYHRSPGKQELLQSFASVKSRVEAPAYFRVGMLKWSQKRLFQWDLRMDPDLLHWPWSVHTGRDP